MERNARKGSAKRHQNKFFPVDEDLLFEKSLPKSCFLPDSNINIS